MKITALGTGDVVGTPKVGCNCPICSEAVKRGISRLRTSLLVEHEGKNLLIDTGPDLRVQLLNAGSPHIDAVIWTHGHYDHFMGFGDFYRVQREEIPVFGAAEVLGYCGKIFSFIKHSETVVEPFVKTNICGLDVTIFPVVHDTPTYGMRIEADGKVFVYSCDTNRNIPARSLEFMRGADLLLLDAIFPDVRVPKHMNIADAEDLAQELEPKIWYTIHMSHKMPLDYIHASHDMQIWVL